MSLVITCAQRLTNLSHFRSLEVVDRAGETQLQGTENYNLINQNLKGQEIIVRFKIVPLESEGAKLPLCKVAV